MKLKIVTTCYYDSSNKLILFLEVQYSFDFDTKQSHTWSPSAFTIETKQIFVDIPSTFTDK